MIFNNTVGRGGSSGKDGITPHIGDNGNWFLDKEDTGVKASGQSTTEILPVTISPEDWDTATNQVIIDCEGVSINEEEQVVTLSPALNSKTVCTACEIKCVECNNDNLTLQATTLPTEEVTIYVAITKAGGAQSSGIVNNVYFTEETVVGTWVDGKPIYRRVIFYSGTIKAGANITLSSDVNQNNIFMIRYDCFIQQVNGAFVVAAAPSRIGGAAQTVLLIGNAGLQLLVGADYPEQATGAYAILEYTKTTDIATIEIPSATAMMAAYEEGVSEA